MAFTFSIQPLTVKIEFPALDRLMTYLENAQQKQVDDAVERLEKSRSGLQASVDAATAAANQP